MLKKLWKNLIAISLAFVCCFSVSTINMTTDTPQTVCADALDDEIDSLFDGVTDYILDSGSNVFGYLSELSLGGVGTFLCKEAAGSLFSYLLSKNQQESYIKEVSAINDKLKSIKNDLSDIITLLNKQNEDAKKSESRKAMDEFFNVADTFSSAISSIYEGYNDLVLREKELEEQEQSGKVVTDEAKEALKNEEKMLYENNLRNIFFGNGTSVGDLYLQLINFLDVVVTPSRTRNQTLMENFNSTYEHLWAFDTQSFAPKKEFIGYVSTSLLHGITLYKFQNLYETSLNEKVPSQLKILNNKYETYKTKAEVAFEYLKKELKLVEDAEKESKTKNCVTHLATGKTVSRKLFVGKLLSSAKDIEQDATAKFGYLTTYNTDYVADPSGLTFRFLNNNDFVSAVEKSFAEYKKNYGKSDDFTLAQFLQEAGFTCDNWDNLGLYTCQDCNYSGSGLKLNNQWRFTVKYTNEKGQSCTKVYIDAVLIISKRTIFKLNETDFTYGNYMAFVSTDGILSGSYKEVSVSVSNSVYRDRMYKMIRMKSYEKNSANMGKVW